MTAVPGFDAASRGGGIPAAIPGRHGRRWWRLGLGRRPHDERHDNKGEGDERDRIAPHIHLGTLRRLFGRKGWNGRKGRKGFVPTYSAHPAFPAFPPLPA